MDSIMKIVRKLLIDSSSYKLRLFVTVFLSIFNLSAISLLASPRILSSLIFGAKTSYIGRF